MKSIREIEKTSIETLEKVSCDAKIAVPENLDSGIRDLVSALEKTDRLLGKDEREKKSFIRKYRLVFSAAASIALAAGLGIAYMTSVNTPKDTYDDPRLAYAEVERVFGKLSKTVDYGTGKLIETRNKLSRPVEIVEKATEH
ncbi:MAG: hypothetical protein LKI42_04845 [Bacteroidales bacterium]|jgi:hypothetical protein|nr:hypothetical protein [Bacteroidales bacterium]MCI1786158.1 hypothetical protein [Bacteroidales bacterium]